MKNLYLLVLIELFIGGGGRLFSIGPVSLRMILFGFCILFWLSLVIKRIEFSGQRLAVYLSVGFLFFHSHGLIIGADRGYDASRIWPEFQQSVFWLAAPYFAYHLRDVKMVKFTGRVIQLSGAFLALVYLILLLLLSLQLINSSYIYVLMSQTGDVFFRGEYLLFYKGFLYIGLSMLFFAAYRKRWWSLWLISSTVALVLTLTRGFVISAACCVLFVFLIQRRWLTAVCSGFFIAAAIFTVFSYTATDASGVDIDRSASTDQRIDDFGFVFANLRPSMVFMGEGYGSLIDGRANIENTYLWVLWKLGLIGLFFWLAPLGLCTYYFVITVRSGKNSVAVAFYFGVVYIYIQTATNPYLTNPIGLSYVIISIFSLRTLAASVATSKFKGFDPDVLNANVISRER